jgi:hypothetical protein
MQLAPPTIIMKAFQKLPLGVRKPILNFLRRVFVAVRDIEVKNRI